MNRFLIVRLASKTKFCFLKEYINSLKSEKGLERVRGKQKSEGRK